MQFNLWYWISVQGKGVQYLSMFGSIERFTEVFCELRGSVTFNLAGYLLRNTSRYISLHMIYVFQNIVLIILQNYPEKV